MIRAIWIGSTAAAILCTGLAFGQQSTAVPPTYNKGDTITLQEPGKGETKVKVVKATRGADGKMTYEVEDAKTGDKAVISDSPAAMPAASAAVEAAAPRKKGLVRSFTSRFRGNQQKETTPAATPIEMHDAAKQNIENHLITPATETKETPAHHLKPVSGTMPKNKNSSKKTPMSKAPATDWQQSWGKADDHRSTMMNMNNQIQTVSYDDASTEMAHRPMMESESVDGVISYPMQGSPYWRVPAMPKQNQTPGIAKVSK